MMSSGNCLRKYFSGWAGVSEAQLAYMIERARPVPQQLPMFFSVSQAAWGGHGNP